MTSPTSGLEDFAREYGPPIDDAHDLANTQPEPGEPVVEGLFDRGDRLQLVGPSKSRKSFLGLQAALGSQASDFRLPHVFRDTSCKKMHPAWGTMIHKVGRAQYALKKT